MITKNIGMLLLAIYLIAVGIVVLTGLDVGITLGVLALLAGIFILMLAWGDRSSRPARAMQDAHGVNLATLFTPRNETNTYSSAERLRDDACSRLVARAKAAGWELV